MGGDGGVHTDDEMGGIRPEDFAGLAERLAKQAEVNKEANDD